MRKFFSLGIHAIVVGLIFSTVEVLSEHQSCPFQYGDQDDDKTSWYGKVTTGYAYSFKAGIDNPDPLEWDASVEGYNSRLGGSPFIEVGFGRSFAYYLRADVAYTFFQGFQYEKFQTGISDTIGFTGDRRIRFFDLNHQNVMFNFSLYPEKHAYFSMIGFDVSPFLGVGVGAGFHRVSNFHTVAYTDNVGSTTSLGLKANTASFAWQGFAGVRLHPCDSFMNLDLGYRYYDGGSFKGPTKIYVNTAAFSGAGAPSTPFKGKLKTHQFTVSFNFWF